MTRQVHSGGCQCGAIRYKIAGELGYPHICHCRMCQKASGNLFMALAGTALGLLFSPPGGGRGRLFALALVYTMVSAALSVLLAELLSLADHRFDGALALLLAFFANSAIPALRAAINARLKHTIGGQGDSYRIDDGFGRRDRPRRDDDDFDGTWKGD